MGKTFHSIALSFRFSLAVLMLAGLLSMPTHTQARQIVAEDSFKIELPDLWNRAQKISPGFEVGFQKRLPNGLATFYFHHEIIPPGTNENLFNTPATREQFDALIRRQFPDALLIDSSSPVVKGKIIVNLAYHLTDSGKRLKRRYTYFISDRTSFVVQCSTAPEDWESALVEFDKMIGSLASGNAPLAVTVSDETAVGNLKQQLSTLLVSWPPLWSAELGPIEISTRTNSSSRNLHVALIFIRRDIGSVYEYTRVIFEQIKQGIPEEKIDALFKDAIPDSLKFIHYIGQVWGAAWSTVWKCDPPLDQFRISIADIDRNQVGAVLINREDGQAILSGKIAVTETKRVAEMYHFE